jgi:uncharacterized repeat protein (TIGR03847 family)
MEKEQAAVLAEKIDEILDGLMNAEGTTLTIPAETPLELVDNDPLDEPVEEAFRTGALSLGWHPSTAQIEVQAYSLVESDDEDSDGDEPDEDDPLGVEPEAVLLLRMPVGTARAFAKRTREIVGAGRPLCPFCGMPIEAGHECVIPGML